MIEISSDFNFTLASWFLGNVHVNPFQHTVGGGGICSPHLIYANQLTQLSPGGKLCSSTLLWSFNLRATNLIRLLHRNYRINVKIFVICKGRMVNWQNVYYILKCMFVKWTYSNLTFYEKCQWWKNYHEITIIFHSWMLKEVDTTKIPIILYPQN